jgi:hypothetical protein
LNDGTTAAINPAPSPHRDQPTDHPSRRRPHQLDNAQWRPSVTTPDTDEQRRRNQQRIDALRDQVIAQREDTADELVYDREGTAAEDYRRDDDEQLDENTDFHTGLGY